ncbi:hypothetical protein LR48_Vigan10g127200 [Vigna angularis]|uniref:Uncharacterized protein n=1 Tax=Phaseolus angularis TaxID=3914 RepID=A0A0L9VJZ9_PHAAN|nr:hypothetical protein LR48_Vigan10g127200 [Vigna angularis]
MSSSSFLSDEVADEGQGYAADGQEPSTSIGSSILGSAGFGDREVEESNIMLEIDASREWTDSAPPPPSMDMAGPPMRKAYIFGEMEKNKAFLLMMSRKETELKKTGTGKSSRPRRSLAIPDRPDTSKPPRTVNPTFKITPYSSPSSTPSVVQVNDEASQDGEKRKVVKDKSVSWSKKKKRKVPDGPLLVGPFDSTVHLADCLEYRLNPEENKLFHGMTTGEAVDLAYELNVRANLCLAYAAGSAKSILAEELESARLDVAKAKKSNEDLTHNFDPSSEYRLTTSKVPLEFPDFDIMKDVVDGKLVVISLKNAEGTPLNENVLPPPNENTP